MQHRKIVIAFYRTEDKYLKIHQPDITLTDCTVHRAKVNAHRAASEKGYTATGKWYFNDFTLDWIREYTETNGNPVKIMVHLFEREARAA